MGDSSSLFIPVDGRALHAKYCARSGALALAIVADGHPSSPTEQTLERLHETLSKRTDVNVLSLSLLTSGEDVLNLEGHGFRQSTALLSSRIKTVIDFMRKAPDDKGLPIILMVGGSAAPAAVLLSARRPTTFQMLVTVNGRLDQAAPQMEHVSLPMLVLFDRGDELLSNLNLESLERAPSDGVRYATGDLQVLTDALNQWLDQFLPKAKP